MADRLRLKNMVFYGYHGVFDAERELGQRYEVDLDLWMDLRGIGLQDDLDAAVNYVDVYAIVKEIVEEREFNLMEALAETIAGEVLSAFSVDAVTVSVRKPQPPAGGLMDSMEVEIHRISRETENDGDEA